MSKLLLTHSKYISYIVLLCGILLYSSTSKASTFSILPDDTTTVASYPIANISAKAEAKAAAKARKQEITQKAKEKKSSEKARRDSLQNQVKRGSDSAAVKERQIIREEKAIAKRNKVVRDSIQKENRKIAKAYSSTKGAKNKKTKIDYQAKKAQKQSIDSLWASRDTINKQIRDSLRLAADSVLMPHRKYVRWSKYFRDNTPYYRYTRDSADTRIVHYLYTDSTRLDERNHMLCIEDTMFKMYNASRSTAINVYDAYAREKDDLLLKALSSDSAVLAARYPGKNRGNLLWRRYNKREHDFWRYLEQKRRTGKLTDNPSAVRADISDFIKQDSVRSFWNDSLKARNFFQQFSFRFNAVSWLLGVPHLGIEFDVSPKPSNKVSIMLEGYCKPRSAWGTNNRRFTYNINAVAGEVRYYWRTGGKQTIQNYKVDNKDYHDSHGLTEFHNYKFGRETTARTSTYKALSYYDIKDSTGTVSKTDTINTRSWLWRIWQPTRYRLSGRYASHPRVKNLYYVGLRGGFEQYHWQLGPKGRQGKDVYAAVTFGLVRNLARFNNGSYLNLDIGGGIGIEYASYSKLGYNTETNCYVFQGHTGRHFTPYPVVKDLHVSLVYSFRSADHKTHNIFGIKRFEERTERAYRRNELAGLNKVNHHSLKQSKKDLKRQNRLKAKADSKAAKLEKDAKKAKKKALREADKKVKDAKKKEEDAEKNNK